MIPWPVDPHMPDAPMRPYGYSTVATFPSMFAPKQTDYPFGVSSTAVVANQAVYARFMPLNNHTLSSASFVVNVAANTNDAVDVGIYDAFGNQLIHSGSTTGLLNSTGLKTVTFSQSISIPENQFFYTAIACAVGGTAAQLISTNITNIAYADLFGTAIGQRLQGLQASALPLPATLTLSTAVQNVPILFFSP